MKKLLLLATLSLSFTHNALACDIEGPSNYHYENLGDGYHIEYLVNPCGEITLLSAGGDGVTTTFPLGPVGR